MSWDEQFMKGTMNPLKLQQQSSSYRSKRKGFVCFHSIVLSPFPQECHINSPGTMALSLSVVTACKTPKTGRIKSNPQIIELTKKVQNSLVQRLIVHSPSYLTMCAHNTGLTTYLCLCLRCQYLNWMCEEGEAQTS